MARTDSVFFLLPTDTLRMSAPWDSLPVLLDFRLRSGATVLERWRFVACLSETGETVPWWALTPYPSDDREQVGAVRGEP